MDKEHTYTSTDKVLAYDTTVELLKSMYIEFKDLSKKKPDAAVSKSKIIITNRLLTKVRSVLNDEESIEFLDLLDEDDIPQVSDVTLILSQYEAAMTAFKKNTMATMILGMSINFIQNSLARRNKSFRA